MVLGKKAGEKPGSTPQYLEEKLTYDGCKTHCMPNPCVSLRHYQLISVKRRRKRKNNWKKD
jgi:hypothetical protein